MLSIVAQLLVPGAHVVTRVVSILRASPGAAATAIGWAFGVVDCAIAAGLLAGVAGVLVEPEAAAGAAAAPVALLVALESLPLPPPQVASTLQSTLERSRKEQKGDDMGSHGALLQGRSSGVTPAGSAFGSQAWPA